MTPRLLVARGGGDASDEHRAQDRVVRRFLSGMTLGRPRQAFRL